MNVQKAMLFLLLAAPCLAGPTITITGGGTIPLGDAEIEGGNKDDLGQAGGAVGAQFMLPLSDTFSVGADYLMNNFGTVTSETIFPFARSEYQATSNVFLVGARLAARPAHKLRPFIFGGLGFHHTKATADLRPDAGIVWADTATREERRILDDSDTGLAGAIAFGLDLAVSERFILGAEARYQFAGKATWHTRSINNTSAEIKGDPSAMALLVRASLRI